MVKCKPYVVPATEALVRQMFGKMRHADELEVLAVTGAPVENSLWNGFRFSEKCWVAIDDETPVACFGVKRGGLVSDTGVPWLLGTDGILNVQREFVRQSRSYVQQMMEGLRRLENWVDARNTVSIKWLRWCGFTVEALPRPYGLNGERFHRFWMEDLKHV